MKIKIFILLSLIITIPIFSQDKYEYDTKIEITGKFFHSDNGNHYTNVLIDVEKIIPIM